MLPKSRQELKRPDPLRIVWDYELVLSWLSATGKLNYGDYAPGSHFANNHFGKEPLEGLYPYIKTPGKSDVLFDNLDSSNGVIYFEI